MPRVLIKQDISVAINVRPRLCSLALLRQKLKQIGSQVCSLAKGLLSHSSVQRHQRLNSKLSSLFVSDQKKIIISGGKFFKRVTFVSFYFFFLQVFVYA